jgi:hypothetical protein
MTLQELTRSSQLGLIKSIKFNMLGNTYLTRSTIKIIQNKTRFRLSFRPADQRSPGLHLIIMYHTYIFNQQLFTLNSLFFKKEKNKTLLVPLISS